MEIIEKIRLLDAWIAEEKEYKERALLVAAKTLLLEQAKRIEQALFQRVAGELCQTN